MLEDVADVKDFIDLLAREEKSVTIAGSNALDAF